MTSAQTVHNARSHGITANCYTANDSRMLQLADHVAHAIFMKYEQGDDSLLTPIQHKFDSFEGRNHGLVLKRG